MIDDGINVPIEIFSIIVATTSVILSIVALIAIAKLKAQNGMSISLVILVVATVYDLVAPLEALFQTIAYRGFDLALLDLHYPNCQIFGFIQTIIPFLTTGTVAILALERYIKIFDLVWGDKVFYSIIVGDFLVGFIFSTLAAVEGSFILASNNAICMISYERGIFGRIWYFTLIASIILHTCIMLYCYTEIFLLHRTMILSQRQKIEPTNSTLQLSMYYEEFSNNSTETNNLTSTKTKSKPNRKSTGYLLRALILMVVYLILVVPTIIILIFEPTMFYLTKGEYKLDRSVSSIPVGFIFLFSIFNPLFILTLHTGIANQTWLLFSSFLSMFRIPRITNRDHS